MSAISPLLQAILQQQQASSQQQNPTGAAVPASGTNAPTAAPISAPAPGAQPGPTNANPSTLPGLQQGGSNASFLSQVLGMNPESADQYDQMLWNPMATYY